MKIEKKKVAGSDQEYIVFKNTCNEKITLVAQGDSLRCAIRGQDDTSMHAPFTRFTRNEVRELLLYLRAFAETGTFDIREKGH